VSDRSIDQLANEWVGRLEAAQPFIPAVPREGLFPERTREISKIYQQLFPYNSTNPAAKDFYEAYRYHIEQARPELAQKLPHIRDRFKDFYKNTGIEDYEPIEKYPQDRLAGLFGAAQHEIYAHELPYKAGMMPDYSGFYAGKNNLGAPTIFGPNSVTPFNEAVAVQVDDALRNHFKGLPIKASALGNAFDNYFSKDLAQAASIVDPESKITLKDRVKAFYPGYVADVDAGRLAPVFDRAGQLFLQKYLLPAADQYEGAVRTQFPGLAEQHGVLHGNNMYDALLRVMDKDFAEGRPFISGGDYYLNIDPLSAAASAVPGVLSNIKRVPASLLPGAADLIPSPEAIRTGYTKGPVEMGKQMAQEFAQSLPTAAGAAMLLSTPALAPLAPGIGAGVVGTAGAKALNEVVRQETGEGIVPKVRQFLGTAPRTGVSAPQAQSEKPLTAQIRPLTQAQRQKMNQQATQNELQRRMDLAKQRVNWRKGELGLTELLFGR
jgi:hypothetical protein